MRTERERMAYSYLPSLFGVEKILRLLHFFSIGWLHETKCLGRAFCDDAELSTEQKTKLRNLEDLPAHGKTIGGGRREDAPDEKKR